MNAANVRFPAEMPRDDGTPVFKAPWEAQAFAIVMTLHSQGLFSWDEWTKRLGEAIAAAQRRGDPDLGDTYFEHWLAALETLLVEHGLTTADVLARRMHVIQHEQTSAPDHHDHADHHEH
jgi:nitrile hydratase accessory protein